MRVVCRWMVSALWIGVAAGTFGSPAPVAADQGDCAQPVSAGPAPVASDCLYILNVAVGAATCDQACACAPKGALPTTASDALVCLSVAVAGSGSLACPCAVDTTTTSTLPPTTTTIPATTTTLADPCSPNPCENGGDCTPIGSEFFCSCIPEWTGPTCEQCGTLCSDSPEYYRGRFLSCVVDTGFCDRPPVTCPEFCAGWMGCAGDLFIDGTYGTVAGVVECF
jgi:hypothetical protein